MDGYGDSWAHRTLLLDGDNLCPPEDAGGNRAIWRACRPCLTQIHDCLHMMQWHGGSLDLTAFALQEVKERQMRMRI